MMPSRKNSDICKKLKIQMVHPEQVLPALYCEVRAETVFYQKAVETFL